MPVLQRIYCLVIPCLLGHGLLAQRSLTFFLETARQNNPVMRLDSLQVVANRLALEQQKAAVSAPLLYAEGGFLAAPVISTDQGKTRLLVNPSKATGDYYGYDLSLTNGGLYRGVVNLEQPLLTRTRTRVLQQQMELQDAQLAQHTRYTIHQLEKIITDQYLLCQYTLQQQEVTRHLLELVQEQARVGAALAKNALIYQADVQLLRIEAEHLSTILTSQQAGYMTHILELNMLCGIKDSSEVALSPLTIFFQTDTAITSGFTEQYRLDSLALIQGQRVFDLRYKPQLSLYSSGGLNTAYAPDIPRRLGWQAGLRFTQVIFDGHQRQLNDRRIHLVAQTTAWQTDFFRDQNTIRKTRLQTQVRALDTQESAVNRQQQAYDSVLILYKQQVVNGGMSIVNYLTLLRSRAALQQDLATIAYNRELLINEYNYWNW